MDLKPGSFVYDNANSNLRLILNMMASALYSQYNKHTYHVVYIFRRCAAVRQNIIEVAMVDDEDSARLYHVPEVR